MQTLLPYLPSASVCKKCGLLTKCNNQQDSKLHKRVCQPYNFLKSGAVIQHIFESRQNSLDGKAILPKKSKKILFSKSNKRIYTYIKDLQGAVDFKYSGILTFVDQQYKVLGCLFYRVIESKIIITYIWTHHLHKRMRIATRLLDALEKYLRVAKSDICCTQLTEDGEYFFKFYFKKDEIKIYSN
eukprot:NODE_486_length_7793_cov_0.204315.p4 type:complete len:185 gc:universal NODE_486_length_7793_cov_0.204315:4279-4833(+)